MIHHRADLQPPLGSPGGVCHTVHRVVEEVDDQHLEDSLVEKVKKGKPLTNPEAAQVYELETIPGVSQSIRQIRIGPHAQYRMDLRGVTTDDVTTTLKNFLKQMNDWKSQRSWQFAQNSALLRQGEPVEWMDPKMGNLVTVFVAEGPTNTVKLVTTFWKGEPDPKPSSCPIKQAANIEPGVKTLVHEQHPTGPSDTGSGGGYKRQVLPSPPNSRSKPYTKTPSFNGPGPSGTGEGERTVHKDMVRTKSLPGDQSPHPVQPAKSTPSRRPGMEAGGQDDEKALDAVILALLEEDKATRQAGMTGPAYPSGVDRERDQKTQAKNYDRKQYKKHRKTVLRKMKNRYKRLKSNTRFVLDRKRRETHPEKFERKPNGGATSIADRSKKQRAEQKRAGFEAVPYLDLATEQQGWFLGVDANGFVQFELNGQQGVVPYVEFLDGVAFLEDSDIDRVLQELDTAYDFTDEMAPGDGDEAVPDPTFEAWWGSHEPGASRLAARWLGVLANRGLLADLGVYEKRPPTMDPEDHYDRAQDQKKRDRPDRRPAELHDQPQVMHAPGSAKVIPYDSDLVNNKAALRISEIQERCSPDLAQKAEGLKVTLRRVDQSNRMWLFDVEGSDKPYRVRLQAQAPKNVRDVNKADIFVSCSCPYWQWQGPEHWANTKGYLFGKPNGTATAPDSKDPKGEHGACKHVLAVFGHVLKQGWKIPTRQASFRFLADRLASGEVYAWYREPGGSDA